MLRIDNCRTADARARGDRPAYVDLSCCSHDEIVLVLNRRRARNEPCPTIDEGSEQRRITPELWRIPRSGRPECVALPILEYPRASRIGCPIDEVRRVAQRRVRFR